MLQISAYNEERLKEVGIHESWHLSHDEGFMQCTNHQPSTEYLRNKQTTKPNIVFPEKQFLS